jgi:hypothetical protein
MHKARRKNPLKAHTMMLEEFSGTCDMEIAIGSITQAIQ